MNKSLIRNRAVDFIVERYNFISLLGVRGIWGFVMIIASVTSDAISLLLLSANLELTIDPGQESGARSSVCEILRCDGSTSFFLALLIIAMVVSISLRFLALTTIERILLDIEFSAAQKIYKVFLCSAYLDSTSQMPSAIVRRITKDCQYISRYSINPLFTLFSALTTGVLLGGAIFLSVDITLIFSLLGIACIFAILISVIRKINYRYGQKILNESTKFYTLAQTSINCIDDIYANGLRSRLIKDFSKNCESLFKVNWINNTLSASPQLLIELSIILVMTGYVIFGVLQNRDISSVLTELIVLFFGLRRLGPVLVQAGSAISKLSSSAAAFADVSKYIATHSCVVTDVNGDVNSAPNYSYTDNNTLRIENFVMKLPDLRISQPISLDITLNPGELLLVRGESGAGKSLLLKAIMGIIPLQHGTVSFPLLNKEYIPFSYLPQFPMLLNAPLLYNLTLKEVLSKHEEADLKKLIEHLRLQSLFEKLDNNLKYEINDFGAAFSGGERQRIGIARTFMSGKPVLIFDEPFSALDTEAIDGFIEILNGRPETIVIMVSHVELDQKRFKHRIKSHFIDHVN